MKLSKGKKTVNKESEERFRKIFEEAPLGIATYDNDFLIININNSLCDMLGYSKEELLSLKLSDIIFHDNKKKEKDFFSNLFIDKLPFTKSSKSLLKKDGGILWTTLTTAIIHDDEGIPIYGLSMIEDITEAMNNEILLNAHIHHLSLSNQIGSVLTRESDLSLMLQLCCEAVIENLGTDFVRIWSFNQLNDTLELQASAGMYTNLNGKHSKITSATNSKIWKILKKKTIILTNNLVGDPQILDQNWIKKEGIIAFAGYPLMVADRVLGVIAFFSKKFISPNEVNTMSPIAQKIALGISRKWAEIEQFKLHGKLRSLTSHIQKVQEKEKKNLARELHDELGQALSAINFVAFNIEQICSSYLKTKECSMVNSEIEKISQLINSATSITEKMVMDLRPVILDHLGLSAALKWLVTQFKKHSVINCKYETRIKSLSFNQEQSIAIYRIIQETITNIGRHSKATKMSLLLKEEKDQIEIIITDNGRGFDFKELDKQKSFGILGMKERVYLFGWDLTFESVIGKGTKVSLLIPKGDTK